MERQAARESQTGQLAGCAVLGGLHLSLAPPYMYSLHSSGQ